MPAKLVEQSRSCCFPIAAGQHFIVDVVKEGNSHAVGRAESLPVRFLPVYLLVDLTA